MRKFFQKVVLWTYIKFHSILIKISIALYNTETEILKADPDDLQEKDKRIQRKLHHNPIIEKFYVGQRDEKYVQDYYELLKKADKFMRKATPREKSVAMDKHFRFNEKDAYGKRYTNTVFFDEKHKHAGKTLGEVLELEFDERRTKDDDYELLHIFNNKPIEVGLAKVFDVVEKKKDNSGNDEYVVVDTEKKSKQFKFPLKIVRNNNDILNKLEELTEFLHVKKIGFEHRQLEFFVPLKFKTKDIEEDSEIFKELIDINEVFLRDEYGQLRGFGVAKYIKRIIHNDTHEVWKFQGIEMEMVG